MNQVQVQVTLIEKQIDWNTGYNKESSVTFTVDEDMAHIVRTMKIRDLSNVARGKPTNKTPSYILAEVGSEKMLPGETSIGSYLYGVTPGTRRIKNTPANEFTRRAYDIN